MTTNEPTPRYTIRPKTYRGKEGFVLRGPGAGIFDPDREVLEAMREAYKGMPDRDLAGDVANEYLLRRVGPLESWRGVALACLSRRVLRLAELSYCASADAGPVLHRCAVELGALADKEGNR